MGNSLLCHYIDNCFKEGIILWGQKHCDWGGKVEDWGAFAPSVPVLKKALMLIPRDVARAPRLGDLRLNLLEFTW